jgi:alpha-1,3-fucosyltransferase
MTIIHFLRSTRKCKWISPFVFLTQMVFLFLLFKMYYFENKKTRLSEKGGFSTFRPVNISEGASLSESSGTVKKMLTTTKRNNKYKSILIWNSPERIETSVFGFGHEPFILQGCQFSDCEIFGNEYDLPPLVSYDAILMHMSVIRLTKLPNFPRQQHQRFVFLTQESPASMSQLDVSTMGNYFNWTMSYRSNSDILFVYGRILPGPSAPKTREETRILIEATHHPSAKNYAANKVHLVAWMASQCETPGLRETYVRQLNKFIPINTYGPCGNFSCTRNNTHGFSDPKCYDMLEANYKFYLSFENTICEEYVTEKFFEIMNHDIVPVVYGGANYSRIAPPHSYIDALKFTPETLANYLKLLDANDELYNEYFWWKGHYNVEAGLEIMARQGFCNLCKKLHQDEGVVKHYLESELVSQWNAKKNCKYFSSWEAQS